MRKNKKKLQKDKLMINKLKFGKKTLKTSLIIKRRNLIILNKSISNMKMYLKLKWMKNKQRKTERK
jgi:hypothetical protein